MTDKVFVDTSVLVYKRDASAPQKQAMGSHLWNLRTGRLSFQVLQEYYVTVTEKLDPGLAPEVARQDVRLLFLWQPIHLDARVLEGAWRLQERYQLSWWDALIVSAAQVAKCDYLLTEDLKENQRLENVRVINPFHISPETLKK
jgi:predicted nucleic acid-binding protein